MSMSRARLPGGAGILIVDLAVVAWVVIAILVGIAVADAVKELTALSESVSNAGRAIEGSGSAIGSLRDLPLVGGQIGDAAEGVQGAGRGVVDEGRAAGVTIERVANLLGLVVALLPILPALALYLPPRLARASEIGSLKRVVRAGAGDPRLERFLAERALHHLSYRELARVSREPWRDLAEGRHRDLAEAELRRVGVRPASRPASS